ncbi:MAG: hypothetical protein KF780_12290 [Sphingomonas sp.]|nr:hypothetical protein [Sphingomonas sp.]
MISSLFRSSGRSAIDLPVAALAALSVAFVAFAAPADLLGAAVALTGLPAILPAAAPPLGATARIVMALGGSAIVFGLVLALLGWLDRFAAPRRPHFAPVAEPESPRLRRRDLHPDAPAVKPISAARDFGSFEAKAVPDWLTPEAEIAPEPQPAPPEFVLPEATDSLPNLMARLEQGLTRRAPAPAPRAAPPSPAAMPANDRLQSAIESLQRLAARQA